MSSPLYRRALPAVAISALALTVATSPGIAQDAGAAGGAAGSKTDPALPEVQIIQEKAKAPSITVAKPKSKPQPVAAGEGPAASSLPKKKRPVSKPATAANSTPIPEQYQSIAPPDTPVEVSAPRSPVIEGVGTTGLAVPASTTIISGEAIDAQKPSTNDTTQLLKQAPGVSIYQAGGVSGLPAINGFNDDRVRILLNGMVVSSACANHMNPPLSYSDPAQVAQVEVLTGVTPVSKGGDSLGGTIIVESAAPHFASPGQGSTANGSVSGFYRSSGNGIATSARAEAAGENVAVSYTGAWSRANNYDDGNGDEVASTEYEAQNHAVQLAVKNGGDLFIVQGGLQFIPYQGYANQRMDMVDNRSWFLNSRYVGKFGWGKLDARAFYQHVDHEMNFLDDKKYNKAPPYRDMPMLTDGDDAGYAIKAEIEASDTDIIRIGNEFHHQALDDWWPATMMMVSMMGPNTYVTLNDATRNRVGTFIEWEKQWDRAWSTLLGVRNDVVWMDTGNVQGYNNASGGMAGVYAADAARFNAQEHAKTDTNFDATALTRYDADRNTRFELAYAMKSRAPNLYERYAWSRVDGPMDNAQMAMNMIGWFGDGNGYTGNLDLKSEHAHTVSVTMDLHDGERSEWQFKVTPYYTYVQDYIGVRKLGDSLGAAHKGFVNLQFANHDAELYGVNFSGAMPLHASDTFGRFALTGVAGYVHGENTDTGVSLYHMMPLHGRFALTHALNGWTSAIELDLVGGKHNVDTTRNELETAGYALVNLRTAYDTGDFRFDIGVENLFDTYYEHPLGGHYIEPTMAGRLPSLGGREDKDNVPGAGRSVYAGVTVRF